MSGRSGVLPPRKRVQPLAGIAGIENEEARMKKQEKAGEMLAAMGWKRR